MKKVCKSIVAVVCAVACGMSVLSGCATNNASNDEKVTLKLWMKPSKDAKESDIISYERLMASLEEKFPNVNIESVAYPQGSNYRQEYDKALMAGTAPAFTNIFSYTDIPERIKNGTVADITEFVKNWDMKKEGKILDTFDDAISDDGKWYALPYKAYVQATLCNVKTLEEAGITKENYPTTWEEFAEVGAKITDMSIPRIGYSLIGMDWCAWPFTAWVWSAGGEMVRENEDGTYKIAFNEDAGIDTAMFMNEMIWKHKMTQKDVLLDYNDMKTNVVNGASCFSFLGFSDLNQKTLDQYGLKISDYVDMPMPVKDASITRPALAGGEVITFNPKLSDKELMVALEVAEYIYFSDERMQAQCDEMVEFNSTDVKIPGRVDWYEKRLASNKGITKEQIVALNELRKNAKAEPYCEHWSDLKSNLVAPLQEIYLTENISRDSVKKLLDECAEKLYSLYPETFKK